jgi:hypothetical protein
VTLAEAAPIAVFLGVLAAFRGQRVTNANLARTRHQEAFAEARMVFSQLSELPADDEEQPGQLALMVRVLGTHAVVDVHTQVWVKTEEAQFGGMLHIEHVLVPDAPLILPQPPVEIDWATRVQWQVSWTDRHGYRWGFHRDLHARHPAPTLLVRPAGRGPTATPTRWQRFSNALWPYDYWPTETVAVLPNQRAVPAKTRLLLPAHPSRQVLR